ncbi:hypothetical protein J6590_095564 [Homalodisca vitripennis]|nr:hypothetical protein J6590_046792 [Homalodisca vitripennis]KAG8309037.1 hypothetical protein J6590_095564 [Homalodisca vitripennis]
MTKCVVARGLHGSQGNFRSVLFRPQITCQIVKRDLVSENLDDLGLDLRSGSTDRKSSGHL